MLRLRLVLAWGLAVACLAPIARTAGVDAADDASAYEIKLKSRRFTPTAGLPVARSLAAGRTQGVVHVILQLWQAPTLEQHAEIEKQGIRLLSYLGGTSYWASMPAAAGLERAGGAGVFRWAGAPEATDKIHPAFSDASLDDIALVTKARSDTVSMLVQYFADVPVTEVIAQLAKLGLEGKPHGASTLVVEATRQRLEAIAKLDSVKWIERGPTPFLELNDTARIRANTDSAQQASFANPQPAYRVSGAGVEVGICDTGVDENHDDFDTVTATGGAGTSRVYNVRAGSGSHGTHVASIAGGSGVNSAANGRPAFSLRGQAPAARIGDYPSFGATEASYHGAIVTDGTDVTNHSYVQSMTVYNTEAADLDSIVRGDATHNNQAIPARPQVWAAGNNGTAAQYGDEEGYYAVFTSAKNTISVGSVDSLDGRLSDYSSLGPTFDGRIKPDVSAPGCQDSIGAGGGIRAADDGTQGYTTMCGTSMAAPVVTGLTALAMDQYQQTYGTAPALAPSSYKALLVQTARDQVKPAAHADREFNNPDTGAPVLYHAGPDFATGYGLVDAEGLRDIVTRPAQLRERAIAATGASQTHCFQVPVGADAVKVTLAWDDLPGDTTTAETAPKLVNDLDLELYDPNGNLVLPWTLDPLPLTAHPGDGAPDPIQPGDVRPAYRGADHRNNVEQASTCGATPGLWRAVVRGHSLPMGQAQRYSLATSHPMRTFCKVWPPDLCHRFPWLCPRQPICERFPWICKEPGLVTPGKDIWHVVGGGPVPIPEICKYAVDCPGCAGSGSGLCPGWRVEIRGLPPEAVAVAINDRGEVIKAVAEGASRAVVVPKRRPGDEWVIVFTDDQGRAFGQDLKLGFAVKPVR